MGIRNQKLEEGQRLESKTLESRFVREIQDGLNCSPFEAQAVLEVVREVYFPYLGQDASPMPGRVSLVAVDADEPAGKSLNECEMRTICLTVHRGSEDDRLLREQGPTAFRRARIASLCQEALSQGAVLTCEDLAYRIFYVSPRTITRDLAALRKANPDDVIALRSIRQDIGPALTHRVAIVRLGLEGKTMSEICQITHHSPEAAANYLSTFARVAQLAEQNMQAGQMGYLLRRSRRLIEQYLELLEACRSDANYAYHLTRLREMAVVGFEKKHQRKPVRRSLP